MGQLREHIRWIVYFALGICGRQDFDMHNDPFPAHGCLEVPTIDQDFLLKNPARKLEMPVTRKSCKRYLSSEEVQKLLAALDAAIA